MQEASGRRGRIFLGLLVILSVLAVAHGFNYFHTQNELLVPIPRGPATFEQTYRLPIFAVLLFAVLVFMSESLAIFPAAVGLAMAPVLGTVSISSALDITSLLIFGPLVTMVSSALGILASNLRSRRSLEVAVFNVTHAILMNWAAGVTFEELRTSSVQFSVVLDAPAVIVAISARFVASMLLHMAYLHLMQGVPLRKVWEEYSRGGPLAENFFIAPIGFLAAVVWYLRPWTVVLVILPTLANYFQLRRHLDVARWNRTLEETVTSRTTDLEQALGRLRLLHQASLSLAQELDLQRTMQLVAEQSVRLTGALGSLVDLPFAPSPAYSVAPPAAGPDSEAPPVAPQEVRAFVRKYAPVTPTVSCLAGLSGEAQSRAAELSIGDLLAVRLGVSDGDESMLAVWAAVPGALSSPTQRADLEAFATQAGIALANSRLYERNQEMAVLAERNRLARELHDSVSQSLFSIVLTAEAAARLNQGQSASGRAMSRVQEIAREALAEMRALIFELRPATLRERGLVYALSNHVELFRRRQKDIEVSFDVLGDRRLAPDAEMAFYRVAQEALSNVAKHADAGRVNLILDLRDSAQVRLEVADDGRGFSPGQQMQRQTLGLTSMRERIENLGGQFVLESAPGRGTRLLAEAPTVPRLSQEI